MVQGIRTFLVVGSAAMALSWLSQTTSAERPAEAEQKPGAEGPPVVDRELDLTKAFGKDSAYSNPKFLLKLSNGYLIGFDSWAMDRTKGVLRLTRCSVVSAATARPSGKRTVAIRSELGIVRVKPGPHDFRLTGPDFADSIQSISLKDGSLFVFPTKTTEISEAKRPKVDR